MAHPQSRPQPSPAVVRNRAMSRVRRLTVAIGIVATTAAVGLGILASSETTAHSAPASRSTGSAASTTPSSSSSSSSASSPGSSATSTGSSSTDDQTATTTTPASTGSGAVTTSGQT